MASRYEQKAEQLMAEARKKLESGGFWSSLFGPPGNKHEDAGDLFKAAANQYKIAKNCTTP